METEVYINASARTNKRKNDGKELSALQVELLHGAMGASTEANELLDMMKKHIFYNKPLDVANIVEEVGDAMWYFALILRELGFSFEEVMRINIEKLQARFPEKFNDHDANNRNLSEERKILEKGVEGGKLKVGDLLMCLNEGSSLQVGDLVQVLTGYDPEQGDVYIIKVGEDRTVWVESNNVVDGYTWVTPNGVEIFFKKTKKNS